MHLASQLDVWIKNVIDDITSSSMIIRINSNASTTCGFNTILTAIELRSWSKKKRLKKSHKQILQDFWTLLSALSQKKQHWVMQSRLLESKIGKNTERKWWNHLGHEASNSVLTTNIQHFKPKDWSIQRNVKISFQNRSQQMHKSLDYLKQHQL